MEILAATICFKNQIFLIDYNIKNDNEEKY